MEQRFRRCKTYPNSLVRGFFLQLRRAFTREGTFVPLPRARPRRSRQAQRHLPRQSGSSALRAKMGTFAKCTMAGFIVLAYGRESEVMLRSVGSNAMEEISGQRLHTRQMLRDLR